MPTLKNDIKPLVRLIIPLTLTGMIQSSVFFFETVFLAHVSPEALAAGALVSWFYATLVVILFGTLSAINILIAHKYGANDHQSIGFIARDGILLAILLAIPGFILLWNMAPIFILFGQTQTVTALASAYLHALAWGILPNFVAIALLEFILGLGHSKTIMLYSVLSVSLTLLFSYMFIFGKFGAPMLGVAGAGWGTTISCSLTVIVLIIYILSQQKYRMYFKDIFNFAHASFLPELLQVGLPMGAMYCVEVGFFFTLTVLMGTFGSDLLAANQIIMQYIGALMGVIFSTAQAITVRMGHLLGEKNVDSAKRTAYIGIILAGSFMAIFSILFIYNSTALIAIDLDPNAAINLNIVQYAKEFFTIAGIFAFFEAIRICYFGALRALKDTHFTLITSIISFWCIALPLGYLLATFLQLSGKGLWWGMAIGAIFSVALLHWRFNAKINYYKPTL
jgi:MATE family multidrug resistance protein